jgi:hypothetical protein
LRGLSRQVGKGKREKKRGKVESRKEKKEEDCGCAITKVFFFFPALLPFLQTRASAATMTFYLWQREFGSERTNRTDIKRKREKERCDNKQAARSPFFPASCCRQQEEQDLNCRLVAKVDKGIEEERKKKEAIFSLIYIKSTPNLGRSKLYALLPHAPSWPNYVCKHGGSTAAPQPKSWSKL